MTIRKSGVVLLVPIAPDSLFRNVRQLIDRLKIRMPKNRHPDFYIITTK